MDALDFPQIRTIAIIAEGIPGLYLLICNEPIV